MVQVRPPPRWLELAAMLAIGHPVARRTGVLAGGDSRGMFDQRDQVAFTFDLQTQHAKAAVVVVKGHTLDEARDFVERGRRRAAVMPIRSLCRGGIDSRVEPRGGRSDDFALRRL